MPTATSDSQYSEALKERMGKCAPRQIQAVGEVGLLDRASVAFLCSVKCPEDIILMAYDAARALRAAGTQMIGGFQSPMEHECFDLLLGGSQPVILALARSLGGMRLPAKWLASIEANRLLLLSLCPPTVKRATADTAEFRNQCIAAIAEQVLIAHAATGGKVDHLARNLLSAGRTVLTFNSSANAHLTALGARSVDPSGVGSLLQQS